VGSSKVQRTNTRVVAATNLNLQNAIEKGKFREDLFYRLSTVPIYVPPLRERGGDIELLFRKFTTDFSESHRVKPISLTNEAKNLLQKQRFPGNIRQLKNLAEQISVLEIGDRIVDEKTGNPYYKIQASVDAKGMRLLGDLKIHPGMPVELFVKTGERSMMSYLLKPILDRTHSALREE
jgi:DNA-binding NtrC family response regulator